jgi:ribose transport system permease protein
MNTAVPPHLARPEAPPTATAPRQQWQRILRFVSVGRLSGVYLLVLAVIVFGILVPDTFLTQLTFKSLLNEQAIFALAALALLPTLAAGLLDISITANMTMAVVLSSWLMVNHGWHPAAASAAAIVAGGAIGAVNGYMVVRLHISSIIATIATQSVLGGLSLWITGNQEIIGIPAGFKEFGRASWQGIAIPVLYMALLAALLWYVVERTPVGRRLLATGGGQEAARLSGIPVRALTFGAFVASGVLASFAGLVLLARVGSGNPTAGEPYLLPAFAAVFLGATQLKHRVNAIGTIIAVYLLATVVKGLQLAGAEFWVPNVFNGVALALAVGIAQVQRRRAGEQTTMAPH